MLGKQLVYASCVRVCLQVGALACFMRCVLYDAASHGIVLYYTRLVYIMSGLRGERGHNVGNDIGLSAGTFRCLAHCLESDDKGIW